MTLQHTESVESLLSELSPAQETVLHLLCEGLTNSQIAAHLDSTSRSVRNIVTDIYFRLGIPPQDPDINPRVAICQWSFYNLPAVHPVGVEIDLEDDRIIVHVSDPLSLESFTEVPLIDDLSNEMVREERALCLRPLAYSYIASLGYSNSKVAKLLFLGEGTVRNSCHAVNRVFRNLGLMGDGNPRVQNALLIHRLHLSMFARKHLEDNFPWIDEDDLKGPVERL